ncbi:hypothetical protein OIU84_007491 [Salix udensis]|uniref:LOB domain-containing protein n=1 Tax=Salix udensis TaxID=889485 RepID=A0AAD6NZG9_9ROSI|nr:hypothetical protein OIU84_007491 [Salix udensis]
MLKLPLPILSKNPDILTTKLTHQAPEVSIKSPPPDFDFSHSAEGAEWSGQLGLIMVVVELCRREFNCRTGIMDTSSEVVRRITSSSDISCKYLRRRCPSDCIFSPYFPSHNPQRFACVHRIHGACNVAKMLQQLPAEHLRAEAANSLYYEAQCRTRDPVYGCVGIISSLHQQIHSVESQLAKTKG